MSDTVLKDGTGTGSRVKIGDDNRLRNKTVISQYLRHQSETGMSYILASSDNSVSASTEYQLLYFQNLDTINNFYLSHFVMSFDGGSGNTSVAKFKFNIAMTAPTANNTAYSPFNKNLGSKNIALCSSFIWNGTGSGMTISSTSEVFSIFDKAGMCDYNLNDALIISYSSAISISVTPEATGIASIILTGFYDIPMND